MQVGVNIPDTDIQTAMRNKFAEMYTAKIVETITPHMQKGSVPSKDGVVYKLINEAVTLLIASPRIKAQISQTLDTFVANRLATFTDPVAGNALNASITSSVAAIDFDTLVMNRLEETLPTLVNQKVDSEISGLNAPSLIALIEQSQTVATIEDLIIASLEKAIPGFINQKIDSVMNDGTTLDGLVKAYLNTKIPQYIDIVVAKAVNTANQQIDTTVATAISDPNSTVNVYLQTKIQEYIDAQILAQTQQPTTP